MARDDDEGPAFPVYLRLALVLFIIFAAVYCQAAFEQAMGCSRAPTPTQPRRATLPTRSVVTQPTFATPRQKRT